jgi:hypothetical protein
MKKQLLTLLFTCFAASLTAQEQEQHEFTFGVYSGLSPLSTLSSALKSGVGVVLGYNWFFSNTMGISTGIEYSYLRCRSSVDELSDRYYSHDAANMPFEFRYTLSGYREIQSGSSLVIPLVWRIQYPLFHDDILNYFAVGGKMFIPLRLQYSTSGSKYTTSGYYPQQDLLIESMPEQGFGDFTGWDQTSNLDFRIIYMFSVETGIKFDLSNQFSLYGGLYLDHALKNINRDYGGKPFLVYHPEKPQYYHFNSVLNSRYTTEDGKTALLSDRMNPLIIGVVIRLAFKLPD